MSVSWVERRPEPTGLWIRWSPRRWPGPASPWCDLARATLGLPGEEVLIAAREPAARIPARARDTLYLPPGPEVMRASILNRAASMGLPLLIQALVGESQAIATVIAPKESAPTEDHLVVWDPLAALLSGQAGWVDLLDEGWHLVWPLIAGLSDDPEEFSVLCRRLVERGVATLQPLLLDLAPRDKRWLWENRSNERLSYEALFHPEPISEGEFVECAEQCGLSVVVPRGVPAHLSGRQVRCRKAAVHLALTAETLIRGGGSPSRAQAFYRASALVEETHLDLDALARDGNLAFLDLPPTVVASLETWLSKSEDGMTSRGHPSSAC